MSRLIRPLAATFEAVHPSWRASLKVWREGAAGRALVAEVDRRLAAGAVIYPARPLRALEMTPRESVRVIIVGQDPYHGAGQAEGLAFSVPPGVLLPPSLRNIFSELSRDVGVAFPATGHLGPWARRGVLLLNTTLTVEDSRPGSHAKLGWEVLTDMVLADLAEAPPPKVFMLWGAHAQAKAALVEAAGPNHLVLRCNHPSPLSARRPPVPFTGCGHFNLANAFLDSQGGGPVDWSLA